MANGIESPIRTNSTERKSKNPLEVLVEILKQLLLARLKSSLTETEYQHGDLRLKLDRIKVRVGAAERLGADVARQKPILEEVGKLFQELDREKNEFRRNRDEIQTEAEGRSLIEKRKTKTHRRDDPQTSNRQNRFDQAPRTYEERQAHLNEQLRRAQSSENEAGREQQSQAVLRSADQESVAATKKITKDDSEFDKELSNLASRVNRLEQENSELRGVSGVGGDPEVVAQTKKQFASLELAFSQTVLREPGAGIKTLERLESMVAEPNLDYRTRSELVGRLEKLRYHYRDEINRSSQGLRREVQHDLTEEERANREKEVDWLVKRANKQQISVEEAALRVMAIEDQGLDPRRYQQYRGSEFMRRGYGPTPEMVMTGEEGETERFQQSPREYYFTTAEVEIRKEYGELNAGVFEEYVNRLALEIMASEAPTVDYQNQGNRMTLQALLKSDEILARWGVERSKRDELRDSIYGLLAQYDFSHGHRHANTEQIAGMSKQVGMDKLIDSFKYDVKKTIQFVSPDQPGQVSDAEVLLRSTDFIDMTLSMYWGSRALSRDASLRSKAAEQMVLYQIVRQLPGWKNVLRKNQSGEVTGEVDFSRIDYKTTEDGDGFKVWIKGQENRQFVIKGFRDMRRSPLHNASELMNQLKGMAVFAQMSEKATQRLYLLDPHHQGDVNDSDAKVTDNRYPNKFGIPLWHKIMKALDSRRRDLITETAFKGMKPLVVKLAEANGTRTDQEELMKYLQYMMKNSANWLMTTEMMLSHWDQLMVEGEVQKDDESYSSRFDYLSGKEKSEALRLMNKFAKDSAFDWGRMINHFLEVGQGGDYKAKLAERLGVDLASLPDWVTNKGMNGFRTAILAMNRKQTYNTNALWDAVGPEQDRVDVERGSWTDDMDKHYDYKNRIAKSFSTKLKFARNPRWENREAVIFESGAYDHMSRRGVANVIVGIEEMLDQVHNWKLKTEVYKTNEDHSLKPHKDEQGLVKMNEEGVLLYEVEKRYVHRQGMERKLGSKPMWMRENELNQMLAGGMIDHQDWDKMRLKYIETLPLGIAVGDYLSKVPLAGNYLKYLWSFDFHFMKDWPILGSFMGNWRIGLGPMIGRLRAIMSASSTSDDMVEFMKKLKELMGQAVTEGIGS
jgi:hypothetical protein